MVEPDESLVDLAFLEDSPDLLPLDDFVWEFRADFLVKPVFSELTDGLSPFPEVLDERKIFLEVKADDILKYLK